MTGIEPAFSAWESVRAFAHRAWQRHVLPGQPMFSAVSVLLAVVPSTSLFRVLLGTFQARTGRALVSISDGSVAG